MKIVGYLQTSLIEWPGKIASVIFAPGCNFRCPFCHNADLVDGDKISKLESFKIREVLADLKKRKKWIDGVAITGGEPTLQPGLDKFLEKLKKMGFQTMLETNGSKPKILQQILNSPFSILDYIAMDFKAPWEDYPKVVKIKKFNPNAIKKSIQLLLESKIPFELRTTIVPGIHDQETLVKMAKDLKKLIPKRYTPDAVPWHWQNFQSKNCLDPEFEKIETHNRRELEALLKPVKSIFSAVRLRD